jgi:eukaryotic-like serine/threonine-protein kinase
MCDQPEEVRNGIADLQEHYEGFEENNRGANGYLFFAKNKVSQQDVAIKFYCGESGDKQHDEPRQLAAINSPNVLSILDARMISGDWGYFITPRCTEGDLDDLIRAFPSAHTAINAAIAICHGVSAIHAHDMVHRDLKPGNIVFDGGIPKIADFGSVRALEKGQEITCASRHSVLYRPPESFESDEYSKRGDVYQIGLVTYQMLGGEFSYNGEHYLKRQELREYASLSDPIDHALYIDRVIARRACEGTLIKLSSLPPWVSRVARRCINQLTAPDPDKRISNVSETAAMLSHMRTSMRDWKWDGQNAILVDNDKRIEICPTKNGQYEAFQVKKGSARRVRGVRPGNLGQVLCQIE